MRKSKAFTMMELMVAVTIIIILFAMLIPVYVNAKKRAHDPIEISRMRQVYTAFSLYAADNSDTRPDHFKQVTDTGYIKESFLRSPNDKIPDGYGYAVMKVWPGYAKNYEDFLVQGRSCLFSFEMSTWRVVDFWAEQTHSFGIGVSPISFENELWHIESPMTHMQRYARLNLDGSVLVRIFKPDFEGKWNSVLLFTDTKPNNPTSSF